jgi:hypothetical protein
LSDDGHKFFDSTHLIGVADVNHELALAHLFNVDIEAKSARVIWKLRYLKEV